MSLIDDYISIENKMQKEVIQQLEKENTELKKQLDITKDRIAEALISYAEDLSNINYWDIAGLRLGEYLLTSEAKDTLESIADGILKGE